MFGFINLKFIICHWCKWFHYHLTNFAKIFEVSKVITVDTTPSHNALYWDEIPRVLNCFRIKEAIVLFVVRTTMCSPFTCSFTATTKMTRADKQRSGAAPTLEYYLSLLQRVLSKTCRPSDCIISRFINNGILKLNSLIGREYKGKFSL